MKETLGKEFYESADKVVTISRPETFEDYLQRLKDRRTEDDYKYTDEDFKNHIYYIFDCYEKDLSVYKCLEFMYFAERDIDDHLFNREPKQETLEEAAEIFVDNRFTKQICGDEFYPDILASKSSIVESHILFAKWQQQKVYSEEEVNNIFYAICKHSFFEDNVETVYIQDVKDEFEQFKNK
jgi:hypothetical protein